MDIYRHDACYREQGYRVIAGLDEAGRGPLAGPVVASAVVLTASASVPGLRDSKKIPEKERELIFWEILVQAEGIGVGIVDHDDIDRLNILEATKLAMAKAVMDLAAAPSLLIIDAVKLSAVTIPQVSLVRAESKSAAVAAASVVAKFVRDSIMLQYHSLYPQYNFRKHKGYGTREHLESIFANGPCPIHRKTFRKVMSPELPLKTVPS